MVAKPSSIYLQSMYMCEMVYYLLDGRYIMRLSKPGFTQEITTITCFPHNISEHFDVNMFSGMVWCGMVWEVQPSKTDS